MARFTDEQIRRYSRQLLLREVGGRGQERLLAARPLLLCHGDVGLLAAEYLWRAGVTELALLAPTAARARRLSDQLLTSGFTGPPARELATAEPELRRLAANAPGFTLLMLGTDLDALLWARCRDKQGVVGAGSAGLRAMAARLDGHESGLKESGAGAVLVGSALALLAIQTILGQGPIVGGEQPDAINSGACWELDLDSPLLPAWQSVNRSEGRPLVNRLSGSAA